MDYLENVFDFPLSRDLNMYCCGKRIKTYNHSYGPAVRERFLLTFVNEGEGFMEHNGDFFELKSHDLLVVYPGEKVYYKVNEGTPWSISWIGAYGEFVEKFLNMLQISRENPVYHVSNFDEVSKLLDNLFDESSQNTLTSKVKCISMIYEFFSLLAENTVIKVKKRNYIKEAIKYIDFSYERPITLSDVAEAVSLEKSYLAKIFKRDKGVTVTEWIRNHRINKACQLLETTDLTIQQIALSVGVDNQLYFSKVFKKIKGVSPTEYRKRLKERIYTGQNNFEG